MSEYFAVIGIIIGALLGYVGTYISTVFQRKDSFEKKRLEAYANWMGFFLHYTQIIYDIASYKYERIPAIKAHLETLKAGTPESQYIIGVLEDHVKEMKALVDQKSILAAKTNGAEALVYMSEPTEKFLVEFEKLNVMEPQAGVKTDPKVVFGEVELWFIERTKACNRFSNSLCAHTQKGFSHWVVLAIALLALGGIAGYSMGRIAKEKLPVSKASVSSNGNKAP